MQMCAHTYTHTCVCSVVHFIYYDSLVGSLSGLELKHGIGRRLSSRNLPASTLPVQSFKWLLPHPATSHRYWGLTWELLVCKAAKPSAMASSRPMRECFNSQGRQWLRIGIQCLPLAPYSSVYICIHTWTHMYTPTTYILTIYFKKNFFLAVKIKNI